VPDAPQLANTDLASSDPEAAAVAEQA
jgi:hypothetical protein